MPTTYSDLLRIALQETGENENTWGVIANENTFSMLQDAIARVATVDVTTGSMALSTENGVTDQARCAAVKLIGSPVADLTVTIPTSDKIYVVHNALSSAFSVTITTGGGSTVVLPQGMVGFVYTDGSNVFSIVGPQLMYRDRNLADLTNISTARTNLGLKELAVLEAGSGLTVNGTQLDVTITPADTGDITASYRASKSGWLLLSGDTIGNASSGATLRANADTQLLYELLWAQCTNAVLPIQTSAGVATDRGLTAVADFNAGKRLPVPDWRGRSPIGRDDMGGTAANRITNDFDGTILANSGGVERVKLTASQSGGVSSGIAPTNFSNQFSEVTIPRDGTLSGFIGNASPNDSGGARGIRLRMSDAPENHTNVQPSITVNWFIKL